MDQPRISAPKFTAIVLIASILAVRLSGWDERIDLQTAAKFVAITLVIAFVLTMVAEWASEPGAARGPVR